MAGKKLRSPCRRRYLRAHNMNAWLSERLIRITDGGIRAVLSDRYRIMDSCDAVLLALDEFKREKLLKSVG